MVLLSWTVTALKRFMNLIAINREEEINMNYDDIGT